MSDPYDNDARSSVLGPTLKFKGELKADEDLLIQGKIEGSIKHTSSLTIGESGHVKADVTAEYIAVDHGSIARKPDGLSWEQAASLPLAAATATQGGTPIGAGCDQRAGACAWARARCPHALQRYAGRCAPSARSGV